MWSVEHATRIKEDCRESLGLRLLDELRQDVRYAARTLIRNPGFTTVAVLTLALGIGATTAIFSVVNAVLLRALPYRDADRIVTVWQANVRTGAMDPGASPANFLDWRQDNQLFTEMSAAEPFSHNLTGYGEPESFRSWLVTTGFFHILGVDAFLGRTFTADEYRPGGEPAVVLGYGLWQRRFGADRSLIGQRLRLNGQAHTVVGVMPPEFQFPTGRELWAPRMETARDRQMRGSGYMPVIARFEPETTLSRAQQEMEAIARRLAREYPQANLDRGVRLVPLPEQIVGQSRPALLVLFGAVGLVLLIACSNVANLLLVRASERGRESAIRAALGAGRGRLARQWFTEGACLAVLGGLGGVLLTYWGLDTIVALGPSRLPRLAEIDVDGRVLAFASAASLLTALACGLAPALFAKASTNDSLKERTATGDWARHRVRHVLVVLQIALALILLIGAGLLIRSFGRLLQVNPGFASEKILALEVHVWGWSRTPDQQAAFFEQTLDRIVALPGVQAAGAVSGLPFHDNPISPNTAFTIEGRPAPLPGQEPTAFLNSATADYFRTLGIPLRRGRFYTRFDRQDAAPVALINEALASRYWPNEDPVGRTITARFLGRVVTAEIVGVVGDVRHQGLDSHPRPEFFVPHLQSPYGSMTYVVRTAGDPLPMLPTVKQEIWAVNRNLPFTSIATMEGLVSRSTEERRFNVLLLGTFAGMALMLAGVGIYGLISFSTRQRTHEIGIRLALGASRAGIKRMVVGEGMLLTLLGVTVGLVGAAVSTRVIQTLLFDVQAIDPVTFGAVSALLVAIALIASYLPAHRATKVDPAKALRAE